MRRDGKTGLTATYSAGRQQRCHGNAAVSTTVVMPTDDHQPITDECVVAAANACKTLTSMLIFFVKYCLLLTCSMKMDIYVCAFRTSV